MTGQSILSNAMVKGIGVSTRDIPDAIQQSYNENITDVKHKVAVLDFGLKRNILGSLDKRGFE